MLIYFLFLYCALFFNPEVAATGEHEIKRGEYPFMAFLYYTDNTISDESGVRFLRGAILIHESWLISASIEVKGDMNSSFPRKTLLARLGATHIDANFTLNEDEDEQEREIIQIVRPKQYRRSEWWLTDINLLKTLLPFNLTSTVAITPFRSRPEVLKKCSILIYSPRHYNMSEDKILMKLHVDLYFTRDSCGSYFNPNTMICGGENEKTAHGLSNTNFCEGNRGSPLLCDGDVVGLQTYIENCNPPYLYNLYFAWDNFLSCGMEEKCSTDTCFSVCTSIPKDEEFHKTSIKKAATHSVSTYFIDMEESKNNNTNTTIVTNTTTSYNETSSVTAKTTRLIMHSEEEEEEPTTTRSSVMPESSNVTTLNVTNDVNYTDNNNMTNITASTRRLFPGYFLETTENSDFSDNPPIVTPSPTTFINQINSTKNSEGTTDMTAEAAQEVTVETYVIEKATPERIEGKIDIFNQSTIRTFSKYESEPVTPRMHGYVEEDSNENDSMELGVSVTPRRQFTLGTHHMMSLKPNESELNTTESVTDNAYLNTETLWPIQKIASLPRKPDAPNNTHFQRRARMELQQHRVRARRYRSAANSNQLWSFIMFLNVLALNCL